MQKICIVIPCYNEANRLPVDKFEKYIELNPDTYFCFVNDGSKDNTLDILNDLKNKFKAKINVFDQQPNRGKAEAVRMGMILASEWETFSYIGFFDADLATPLSELEYFKSYAEKSYKVILGSRVKRLGSNIKRSNFRHYLGRFFATLASLMLKMGTYDTQCGAKLFDIHLVNSIFNKPFISKWIFDIEILFRARKLIDINDRFGFFEIPLSAWSEKKGSKLPFSYFFKVIIDLYKINKFYKR